jgi:hypothetical protein
LKSLVVISYHIPGKCVRVFCPYNGYPAAKDNRDSWGTCTTSAECKTVIIVVLTVMGGIDPHKISQDSSWFENSLVVRISSWSWNILVKSSSWSWRFCGELSSWSWKLIIVLSN